MRALKSLIIFLLFISSAFADTVTMPTTYSTGGQVTSTNLNGNFSALAQKINGGLDNVNANTTTGYRFLEIKSSLPTVGTQGRVIFNTADNSLNFDNGSSYTQAVAVSGTPAIGDIAYYSSLGWARLAAGTSGKALLTQGASSNPIFGYPSDLNITSQAQGDLLYFNGTNWVRVAHGTSGQYLESNGTSTPTWGTIATETGTVADGGTISLPSGFTAGQCKWQVGLGDGSSVNGGSHPDGVYFVTTVNASRVVTCTAGSVNVEADGTCTANYIITCQK